MIRMENVSFSYGKKTVLRGFDFSLPDGAHRALMGPSGCGKTTVLRLLMKLEKPDSGEITGVTLPIAAVFQEDRLLAHRTVLQNAMLAGQDRERAERLLREIGLGEVLHAYPKALSGGMKRRVAIVRALCTPSSLLILDEAFTGLDETTRAATAALICKEWSGSILAVIHDPKEAELLGAGITELEKN